MKGAIKSQIPDMDDNTKNTSFFLRMIGNRKFDDVKVPDSSEGDDDQMAENQLFRVFTNVC